MLRYSWMLLKNSKSEAPQKLSHTGLRANIRIQSRVNRTAADASKFPAKFGRPPNLFLFAAPVGLQILARREE